MSLVTILFGIIAALLGGFFLQKNKKDSAEALLQNQETKEKLTKVDESIAKNDGLAAAEDYKRKQLEQQANEEKAKNVTKDDLLDFLNDPNKR
jgi:phage shock protein A